MINRKPFLAAAAALVLTFPASAVAAPAAGGYVALGDSYSAGPLIPLPVGPLGCLRSDRNFPHLLAADLGLPFRDASCSGARTRDVFAPQDLSPLGSAPPQLDALDSRTRFVSLTIGGNDAGFSGVLANCLALRPDAQPCRRDYVHGGSDRLSRRIESVAPRLGHVLRAIGARSPRARVFLLDYPPLLPAHGDGCWPLQPIAEADVPWLRARERQLNGVLARVAGREGAELVRWYRAGVGHDPCRSPAKRWVEPLLPGSPAAPVHPNARGMRAAAGLLGEAIRRLRRASGAPNALRSRRAPEPGAQPGVHR